MADFDINNFLNNMRFGQGGSGSGASKAPSDGANEKETPEMVVEAVGGAVGNLLSRSTGINASQAGAVSIAQPFEYKGWAESEIPSLVSKLNSQGGIIAQIAHTLVKNGVIQDQAQFQDLTEGVGGGDALLANSGNITPSSSPNEGPAGDLGGGMTA